MYLESVFLYIKNNCASKKLFRSTDLTVFDVKSNLSLVAS